MELTELKEPICSLVNKELLTLLGLNLSPVCAVYVRYPISLSNRMRRSFTPITLEALFKLFSTFHYAHTYSK